MVAQPLLVGKSDCGEEEVVRVGKMPEGSACCEMVL
jgi:hypothetical protein